METIPPSNAIFYSVIAALLLLSALAVGFDKLFRRKPSIEAEFATKAELHELEKDMDARFDKLEIGITDKLAVLDNKRSRQVAQLHDDIRDVGSKVDRLLGYNDARDEREGR